MSSYSELIKNFEKIRAYMRDFYVYGFKSRADYQSKSARSYDDERRRLESWLGDHMSFVRTSEGKNVFISIDSRTIRHNPLYIIKRLYREKRVGTVEKLDENTYRFSADVYDSSEMIPWIRTFICRIVKMNFSNRSVENQFKKDLEAMYIKHFANAILPVQPHKGIIR